MKFSSKAVDSILQSINASLPEAELVYLSDAMIHVCSAIKILAFSPDLAQINVRGVLINSIVKDLKKVAAAVKTSKTFAMISPDPYKFDFISNSYKLADGCILYFSILYEEYKEKETIIELSNALKCFKINVLMN